MSKTIYFDASFLSNKGGIGRDSRLILSFFQKQKSVDIKIIYPLVHKFPALKLFPHSLVRILDRLFVLTRIILRRPVYIEIPNNSVFFQSQPSIYTIKNPNALQIVRIHDLFPLTNSDWFRNHSIKYFKIAIQNFNSKLILLCDSKRTISSVIQNIPSKLHESSIKLMYCIPEKLDNSLCENCELCRLQIVGQNYFVNIATIEPRKNHEYLLEVWKTLNTNELKHSQPQLYLIGRYGWKSLGVAKSLLLKSTPGVYWVRQACDGSISRLLESATALLSASFDEGFDLPPGEALLQRTPILISDIPIHHEIYGDFAEYFNLGDTQSLVNLIYKKNYYPDFEGYYKIVERSILETESLLSSMEIDVDQ